MSGAIGAAPFVPLKLIRTLKSTAADAFVGVEKASTAKVIPTRTKALCRSMADLPIRPEIPRVKEQEKHNPQSAKSITPLSISDKSPSHSDNNNQNRQGGHPHDSAPPGKIPEHRPGLVSIDSATRL